MASKQNFYATKAQNAQKGKNFRYKTHLFLVTKNDGHEKI